jgi:hypothetical protein
MAVKCTNRLTWLSGWNPPSATSTSGDLGRGNNGIQGSILTERPYNVYKKNAFARCRPSIICSVSSLMSDRYTMAASLGLLLAVTAPVLVSAAQGVGMYGQCGGLGYTGSTTCVSGAVCTSYNPYYCKRPPFDALPLDDAGLLRA